MYPFSPLFIGLASLLLGYGIERASARSGPDFAEAFTDPAMLITTTDIEETRELLHTVQLPETDAHHDALLKALDDVEAIDSEHLVLLTEAVATPPRLTDVKTGIKSIIKAVIGGRDLVYSGRGEGEFSHVIDDLLLAGAKKLSDVGPQSFGRLVAVAQTSETIVALSDVLLERSDSGSTSDLEAILHEIPWDGVRQELCVEVLIPRGHLKDERADIAIESMSFDSSRTALIRAVYQSLDELGADTFLRHVQLQGFDSGRTDVVEEGVAVIERIDGSLALRLVETAGFDSGREAILKALLPKLDRIDGSLALRLVETAGFDPGRESMLKALLPKLDQIDGMVALKLVETAGFDSGRESMLKALLPKLDQIDGMVALKLVETAGFDSGRESMLKALLPKLDQIDADEMLALVRMNSSDSSREAVFKALLPKLNQIDADEMLALVRMNSSDSSREAVLKSAVALGSNFPAISADNLVSYAQVGSVDRSRNEMLKLVTPHFKGGFTKQSASRLLRAFSNDSGRLDAVALFREELLKLSEQDRHDVLRQFSSTSNREEAVELLLQ